VVSVTKKPPLPANSALQLHAGARGNEGAVADQVLVRTAVDHLHRPRQRGRQQAVAIAARGLDVLLEERLAVGKGAHQGAAKAAAHLALQVERRLHHHHRIRFAVDGFAALQRHVQEGIHVPGHGKNWHRSFLSFDCGPARGGAGRKTVYMV
jgi:hypothetical protein